VLVVLILYLDVAQLQEGSIFISSVFLDDICNCMSLCVPLIVKALEVDVVTHLGVGCLKCSGVSLLPIHQLHPHGHHR
jgi:hypothetical protein